MRNKHTKKLENTAEVKAHALTEEEIKKLDARNTQLLDEIDAGSTTAMADLIVANGRFVENIVHDYAKALNSTAVVDEEDLRSEAFVSILQLLKDNHYGTSRTALTSDIRALLGITLSSYVAEANNNFCDEHLTQCVAPGKDKLEDTITDGKSELDNFLLRQDIIQFCKEEGGDITIR